MSKGKRRLIDRISLELSADVAGKVRLLSNRTGRTLRELIEESVVEYMANHQDPEYLPPSESSELKEDTAGAS